MIQDLVFASQTTIPCGFWLADTYGSLRSLHPVWRCCPLVTKISNRHHPSEDPSHTHPPPGYPEVQFEMRMLGKGLIQGVLPGETDKGTRGAGQEWGKVKQHVTEHKVLWWAHIRLVRGALWDASHTEAFVLPGSTGTCLSPSITCQSFTKERLVWPEEVVSVGYGEAHRYCKRFKETYEEVESVCYDILNKN